MEVTDMIYENYDCLILRDQEFTRCIFKRSTIPDIINCTFYNCIFAECDFPGIIKNSRFVECDIRRDNRFSADIDKVHFESNDDVDLVGKCETCGADGLKIDLYPCDECGEIVCANCVKYIDGKPHCPKCYTQGTCIDCGENKGENMFLCGRCGEMVCTDCMKYVDGEGYCLHCYKKEVTYED